MYKLAITLFDGLCQTTKVVLYNFRYLLPFFRYNISYDCQTFCELENIDHGQDVQHSQWRHTMVNITLYKSQTWAFLASFRRFPDIKNMIFRYFVT